jgi:hypothetical protein
VPDTPSALIITGVAFLLAGLVKGVIGLGLPTVAIGLLSLVMLPAQAAALLIVPSLVTNVWQLAAGPQLVALTRRLWPMMVGIGAGTVAAAGMFGPPGAGNAIVALGVALMLYAGLGLANARFSVPKRLEGWLSPTIGVASGAVTAITGVFVMPGVPYLQALGLPKDDLVQALGLFFTVSTLALAAVLVHEKAFDLTILVNSFMALAASLVGMVLGQRLRHRVSEAAFRRLFFLGMLALGGHLASRALV